MALSFDTPKLFVHETLGAVVAAFSLAGITTWYSPTPTLTGVCSCAILGAFLGISAFAAAPRSRFRRVVWGAIFGGAAAAGIPLLSNWWGATQQGLSMATALGGGILGGWLASERVREASHSAPRKTHLQASIGGLLSAGLGVLGADAWLNFAEQQRWDATLAHAATAGAFALWLSAGVGLRHLHRAEHPLVTQARSLLTRLQSPVSEQVARGLVYFDALVARRGPTHQEQSTNTKETSTLAQSLLESLLHSAKAWQNITDALQAAEPQAVTEKLERLRQARDESEDGVILAHLTRATQAVRAQQHALQTMETQKARALASVEVQLALLERLHVAWLQCQLGESQRFALERDAVSEQVERVADEFDAFTSALQEAEAYSDRDALAVVEGAGRKALERMREQIAPQVPVAKENTAWTKQ